MNYSILTEADIKNHTRKDLGNQNRVGAPYVPSNQALGKNRYERRTKSQMANAVKEFNALNTNKLFKEGILDVKVPIHGETDNYEVTISFGNFLNNLQEELKDNNDEFNWRVVSRALSNCFNNENIYIHCTCPDFKYRFRYWCIVKGTSSISLDDMSPEDRKWATTRAEITNPSDNKGAGCKHICLALNNSSWLIKIASVIYNYVNYMQEHQQRLYADIIYPAIYNKEYTEPVQTDLYDTGSDELVSDRDLISRSNEYAADKGKFKQGNTQGIRFAPTNKDKNQIDFDAIMSDR